MFECLISSVYADNTDQAFVRLPAFVQEVLREDDPKLQELREYGEEAYSAVTKALVDLNTGNGSRRTPFPVLWNPEAGHKVLMKEAVQHALQLWQASKAKGKRGR